jgi:membrane protease YdiL (CAAX protease family)
MAGLSKVIERRPVATYFLLTFALSWGVIVALTGGEQLSSDDALSDPRFLIAVMLAPMAPAVASLLLTRMLDGRDGLRSLGSHLRKWRVGERWYAAALVPAPLVAVATGTVLALVAGSSEFLPAAFTTADPLGLLLQGISIGLLVGLCEETGWTGFAVPRLRRSYSAPVTALSVGFVWGAWHFPLFWEADSLTRLLPAALLLVALFSWLPAYRVLMVWVFDATQSVFIAVLMHASLSATQVILLPEELSDTEALVSMLARSAVWWVIVAVVVLLNRGKVAAPTATIAVRLSGQTAPRR